MQLKDATVLIVDDELVLLEILGAWFARVAGRVLVAANGAEALEILKANHVDVVITDLRMPVMDGATLLRRIKTLGKPWPSVIFVTGFSDFTPREAYDLGAEALLEKPMDRDELLRIVSRSLMPRDELWRTPDLAPSAVLRSSFSSLAAALREKKISFGRGGLCIASSQNLQEGPIEMTLEFLEDNKSLQGQGIVRWTAEGQAGIELLYVAPASRKWVVKLAEQDETASFIPGSLSGQQGRVAMPA